MEYSSVTFGRISYLSFIFFFFLFSVILMETFSFFGSLLESVCVKSLAAHLPDNIQSINDSIFISGYYD